jgi:uncharacterized membrane protein YfcA
MGGPGRRPHPLAPARNHAQTKKARAMPGVCGSLSGFYWSAFAPGFGAAFFAAACRAGSAGVTSRQPS